MVTSGGVYHRLCLSCSECHRVVQDAGQAKKGPEGGLYCSTCYGRQFGHTGRASTDSRIVMAPNGKVFLLGLKSQRLNLYFFRAALDAVVLFSHLKALPVVAEHFIGDNFGRRWKDQT